MESALVDVEIRDLPPMSVEEMSLVDHHSVLNAFNVVRGALFVLGRSEGAVEGSLGKSLAWCDEFVAALRDRQRALAQAAMSDELVARVRRELEEFLVAHPWLRADPVVVEILEDVGRGLEVLRVRARSILARAQFPERWEAYPPADLQGEILGFLEVLAKHSKGRFRIVQNLALQGVSDYLVDLRIDCAGGGPVQMPPVFVEVICDLVANARKFTPTPGFILAHVYEDSAELRLAVRDSGRGIPADELERVMQFGRRGSNALEVRSHGGGYGLTKAFLVTKQFRGRFWIASRVGVGTCVRIVVPRPGEAGGQSAGPVVPA